MNSKIITYWNKGQKLFQNYQFGENTIIIDRCGLASIR